MIPDGSASVRLDIDPTTSRGAAREIEEQPFDLVIIGDFSGRESRQAGAPRSASARPMPIDRDDFDSVLAAIAPRIRLELAPGTPAIEIEIGDIDDFHPDRLVENVSLFAELRELRRRPHDPAAVAEIGGGAPASPPASGAGVLDLILDQAQPASAGAPEVEQVLGSGLGELVNRLVAPHLVLPPDPRQAEAIAAVDAAIADALRRVLHHPAFQAVEALWRAVFTLVRSVETGPLLRIHLVDLDRRQLEEEIRGGGSDISHLARRVMPGDPMRPPTLIVMGTTIGEGGADPGLLPFLAELGFVLEAPVLIGGGPELVGAHGMAELGDPREWEDQPEALASLRRSPTAAYLGIVLPRFLLREPYGTSGSRTAVPAFEELTADSGPEQLLWGNPALAAGMLLAQGYARSGWSMRPGACRDLNGLPVVHRNGELIPTAEIWLTDPAADAILDRGAIPLASERNHDGARIVSYQSFASPPAPLAGRWTTSRP